MSPQRAGAPPGGAAVVECGKPRDEALVHEVVTLLDSLGWYAKHAPRLHEPEPLTLHLKKRVGQMF